MTPHPWQQTEKYITWKFGENVAIKVSSSYTHIPIVKIGKIQNFFTKSAY